MDHLIEGYRRYRANRWQDLKALHKELAQGQQPRLLVIACCDSRVDPATIFDAYPGELFVIRNIANLAPPYEVGGGFHGTSTAIEFAVTRLEVETVLVLGHASCGGVQAAIASETQDVGYFLGQWVGLLKPAKARARFKEGEDDLAHELEFESIRVSLENLMTFPFVAERVKAGKLSLVGAHYGIADGILQLYDAATDTFAPLPD